MQNTLFPLLQTSAAETWVYKGRKCFSVKFHCSVCSLRAPAGVGVVCQIPGLLCCRCRCSVKNSTSRHAQLRAGLVIALTAPPCPPSLWPERRCPSASCGLIRRLTGESPSRARWVEEMAPSKENCGSTLKAWNNIVRKINRHFPNGEREREQGWEDLEPFLWYRVLFFQNGGFNMRHSLQGSRECSFPVGG